MIGEKKRVTTSVGEIAYVDRGAGPVALFVHGVFLNAHLWRHVIDRVAGVRRCLAVDLLSHGDSPSRPDQDISFRGQAAMLEVFCGALGLFLLGTLFGFSALLFLAFHFFLALLERDTHKASS